MASRLTPLAMRLAVAGAVLYTVVHVVVSGVLAPGRLPNVGQVVEELQPIRRQVLTGAATVDHPRQYGPVFLLLFDPVYRGAMADEARLAWYAYALDLIAIGVAFWATVASVRMWLASRGRAMPRSLVLGLALLWGNFGPLYGVLAIKNVELWELAFLMVGCAAAMRGWRWTVAWSIAAATLTKMLPLVFVPYLLLRDRRAFAYTLAAMLAILGVSQLAYGSDMGWRYLPGLVRAAAGGSDFGWKGPLTWHENVSLRGLAMKAFGYLEQPDPAILNAPYQRGYFAVVPPPLLPWAVWTGILAQGAGLLWVAWTLLRRRGVSEPARTFWDWALVAAMLLPLAPQASQDYMTLALGAFSAVLAGCVVYGGRANWIGFAVAVLLVANVLPRGVFSRLLLIDPMMAWSGHQHLTRAEAYQYYGFPLLGLLVLVWVWTRLVRLDDYSSMAPGSPGPPAAT